MSQMSRDSSRSYSGIRPSPPFELPSSARALTEPSPHVLSTPDLSSIKAIFVALLSLLYLPSLTLRFQLLTQFLGVAVVALPHVLALPPRLVSVTLPYHGNGIDKVYSGQTSLPVVKSGVHPQSSGNCGKRKQWQITIIGDFGMASKAGRNSLFRAGGSKFVIVSASPRRGSWRY